MRHIQEAHPLKQGLKHKWDYPECGIKYNSRGTSTKTRIETAEQVEEKAVNLAIQEAHPLKQGLKPGFLAASIKRIPIQEAHPLKQGLKQIIFRSPPRT